MTVFTRGRSLVLLGVVLAAAALAGYRALPPQPRALPERPAELEAPVRGVLHVHSVRSDGTGTLDEIASAAAAAGLQFVILTDHGDGTVAAEPPGYRSGVLLIDAVEISTEGGHVVALGLPQAPYPLGGEARDVIEDVARLGGFSIAAHPGSARAELRWVEWTAPFDGLEWLNADSEWRDERVPSLARVLLAYPFRAVGALTMLLDRPDTVLRRWDVLTGRRRIVAVLGSDAHARIGVGGQADPYDDGPSLPLPAYEQMFRAFSISVPGVALSGDATADATAVIDAIRAGHVYSTIDGLGGPAALSFTAASGAGQASAGDALPIDDAVTLQVRVQAPANARIDLRLDGEVVASATGAALDHQTGTPGAYRVEVMLPGAPGEPPVPWILSNPIYVGRDAVPPPPADPRGPAGEITLQYGNGDADDWRVEASEASLGALDVVTGSSGTELLFRFALGGTASSNPYAALAMPAGPALDGHDRLMFTARADRPMRLSVQMRIPADEDGERWHRSIYLDQVPREITVFFDDFTPRGPTSRRRPTLADVEHVLFVVDTVNAEVGANGRVWLDDVRYGR